MSVADQPCTVWLGSLSFILSFSPSPQIEGDDFPNCEPKVKHYVQTGGKKKPVRIKLKGLSLCYVFNLMNSEYMSFAILNIHYIVFKFIKLLAFYYLTKGTFD